MRALLRFCGQGEQWPSKRTVETLKSIIGKADSICDPSAGYGLSLIELADALGATSAYGVESNKALALYASTIRTSKKINWVDGDLTPAMDDLHRRFDAVVCCLPVPVRKQSSPFGSRGVGEMLSARYCPTIVTASRHIKDSGVAVDRRPRDLACCGL